MALRPQVSRAAIELIQRFEGYRRKSAQLPDGRWTLGYGHTLSAREGAVVTPADAEALLIYDMIGVAHEVDALVFADLTRNQFDALCAFAFSVGLQAFRGSNVLKRVNEGALIQAAFEIELWRQVEFEGERIVVDALVRRRAAEKLLFLTPAGAWRPAPSAILKPLRDDLAPDHAPHGAPAEVVAPLEGERAHAFRAAPSVEGGQSPVTVAAETVVARLQVLFPDGETGADETAHDAEAQQEANAELEAQAEDVAETASEPLTDAASADREIAVSDPEPSRFAEPGRIRVAPALTDSMPRIVSDDAARDGFVPQQVQLSSQDREADGLLGLVLLALLGLAFFAGGVFWAFNARPGPEPSVFTPLLVGWLAGIAGAGFLAVAVYLLLQRLEQAAERRADRGR